MTSFAYGATTVTMEINPLHPRDWEESQEFAAGFGSDGDAYAYDCSAPVSRIETLNFPAISWTNLQNLLGFIENTVEGARHTFTWLDRLGVSRTARYQNIEYQQVAQTYHRVSLTLEVQS